MEINNKKQTYIIVGVFLAVISVPVIITLLGVLGGLFYMHKGAN